jgi:hypothetical protein
MQMTPEKLKTVLKVPQQSAVQSISRYLMEGEVVVMVCYCCVAGVGAHPLHRWLLLGRHFLDKKYGSI